MKKFLLSIFILTTIINTAFCQSPGENLKINWPDEYHWKVGSNQENETMQMIELVPGDETIDNWKMIGTMISYKGVKGIDINTIPQLMFSQTTKTSPDAKLTVFDKDDKSKNPWIIFKIEAPSFTDDSKPESQLFYVIQGETSLYDNFVAIKEKTLPADFAKKWTAVFKAAEIVNK